MGPQSIYAGISLGDPNIKDTAVVRWLKSTFTNATKKNAMLLGSTGSGKTYGAIAYVAFNGTPETVAFVTAYKLSELIQRKAYQELDTLREKTFLIIDDLGVGDVGYKAADFLSFFEDLFIHRHQKGKTTIITSNATKDQVKETFGERFISRFNESGLVYTTPDSDMRQAVA